MKPTLPPDVKNHLETLGDNIKEARLSRGWSQSEMAERSLMSRITYSDIENGVATVQMRNYLQVLDVFNLTHQIAEIAAPHTDEEGRSLRLKKAKR
jgi:transcriptional regulator with XRE-family HTH domain